MKSTTHKKTNFEDVLFRTNVQVAIAYGIAVIALLLLYIALFK